MAYISFQPNDYFNTKLWTGNGSTNALTGVGFQPDWIWIKNRSTTNNHNLFDAVRGANKKLSSNTTGAESTATNLTSFDSDGFTLASNGGTNGNGNNLVSWNWKANGQGSSNTDGTINTTYTSANTTSGFSIVKWTGTEASATVGHGLGAVPKMLIVKCTNDTGATDWMVYHSSLGNTKNCRLNENEAVDTNNNPWDATTPTSSVFSVGAFNETNRSGGELIAYCFAEKKGFSKFGSYTGNGSADGSFIYTGFAPAFVIVKQTNASGESWKMYDNKRPGYNLVNNWLEPDDSQAEGTGSNQIDMVSNGFKARATNTAMNASGSTYIYMAFAEEPLVSSNGVPATAR